MNTLAQSTTWTDSTVDPIQRYQACKAMARGYAVAEKADEERLGHAQAFCAAMLQAYWGAICKRFGADLKIPPLALPLPAVIADVQHLASGAGQLIAEFPVEDAGYLIGSIYTVMLPDAYRSALGAYYTPPPLVSRMLDQVESAGFDFYHGSALDPACGGGAFLAPIALRMVAHAKGAEPGWVIRQLSSRLKGIEIDPFAGWIAQVLVEAAVMPVCIASGKRLPNIITIGDALLPRDIGRFDLVIGNPPYGRVRLDENTRKRFNRSLFGHANLYGLFTDLALQLAKPGGYIAYLTPTSFLGGQYFKALRQLMAENTTPLSFDFIADREGVFDDVLQETMLATYICETRNIPAEISALIPQGLNAARFEKLGVAMIGVAGEPWKLPRTSTDAAILNNVTRMTNRLIDLGYIVSTGPLVWNRHRSQLRERADKTTLPLIWAESVTPNKFQFKAERRNHVPFFSIQHDQPHLVTKTTCVLVQRTTSKEQGRRLVAAVLPQHFLDSIGGAVVENHLNMIHAPSPWLASVSPDTISALINTEAVDRVFRCISGSVAVSAYELNALPLPTADQLMKLDQLVQSSSGVQNAAIERLVSSFYGLV